VASTEVTSPPACSCVPTGRRRSPAQGRYTADLTLTGQTYARFRYADHPHARIVRIDTTKAKALPGVVAVVTQSDVPDMRFGGFVQDRTLFAKDIVRFEGEIVAIVAAAVTPGRGLASAWTRCSRSPAWTWRAPDYPRGSTPSP
jgi:CO/xanthine dehydrogenase Mo-binding subunit